MSSASEPTTASTVFLTTSDVSAALVGAGFSSIYSTGTPAMFAVKSLVISVVSRLASTSTFMSTSLGSMDAGQKNQLVVGILSAIESYARSKNQNVLKAVVSGISIDLIGQEIIKLTNMEDKVLMGNTR
jgi:hypothetical protein